MPKAKLQKVKAKKAGIKIDVGPVHIDTDKKRRPLPPPPPPHRHHHHLPPPPPPHRRPLRAAGAVAETKEATRAELRTMAKDFRASSTETTKKLTALLEGLKSKANFSKKEEKLFTTLIEADAKVRSYLREKGI